MKKSSITVYNIMVYSSHHFTFLPPFTSVSYFFYIFFTIFILHCLSLVCCAESSVWMSPSKVMDRSVPRGWCEELSSHCCVQLSFVYCQLCCCSGGVLF